MRYAIIYSDTSINDLVELYNVICYEYFSPITSIRYVNGIISKIERLSTFPESNAVYRRKSVRQYGSSVRRVNYRKMAILYTVHEDTVYIHRIVPAGSIAGL